jgi:hypothetical protein
MATRIKALAGKIIITAQALKEVSGLDLTECANIVKGNIDFPDECFDELCAHLGNPDLFFEMVS